LIARQKFGDYVVCLGPDADHRLHASQRLRPHRLGMHRHEDGCRQRIGRVGVGGFRVCRQHMVCLVDEQPVRPRRPAAELMDRREQPGEESRPLRHRQPQHIDDRGRRHWLAQNIQHLVYDRRPLAIAEHNRVLQVIVVALGVEHADLKMLRGKFLEDGGRQG
jgi:hypothetical protein